jgi:hypothetical protein
MNRTETLAFGWLSDGGHKDIVFDGHGKIDFVTDGGKFKFEVKTLVRDDILYFKEGQIQAIIDQRAVVLVYKDQHSPEPYAVLEASQFDSLTPRKVGDFRVYISAPRVGVKTMQVEDNTWRALMAIKINYGLPDMAAVLRKVLHEAMANGGFETVEVN